MHKLLTEDHKKKISESLKGRPSPMKGRHQTEEAKLKISNARIGKSSWNKGKKLSEEHKQKIKGHIAWNKGLKGIYKPSEETRKKISNANKGQIPYIKGKHHSEESIKKMSENACKFWLGKSMSEESRKKMSEFRKGKPSNRKGEYLSKEQKNKLSEIAKKLWKNPNYVKKIMIAKKVKPNKAEMQLLTILQKLYPDDWKFVGDGQVIIDGKCPDFINVNGKKLIIELFGNYWHKGENPEDRIKIFEPFGYKTLIIWENELRNKDLLEKKMINFVT